jgi:hypothetical protein
MIIGQNGDRFPINLRIDAQTGLLADCGITRDSTAVNAGEPPTISSNIDALSISSRRATFSWCSLS